MAKKTLTLYLAKDDVHDFEQVLSENAREKVGHLGNVVIDDNAFAERARVYVFKGPALPPKWLNDLRRYFTIGGNFISVSSCALICFEVAERVFVATFGHGWMYLSEENIQGDFGLKVAINALDDEKLKRLERANLGDALKGVSLSPFQRDFKSFGVDDVLDLVKKISGVTREDAAPDRMTGAKSLKVTGDYSLDDLPEIATEALGFYSSTDYQDTDFNILDDVMPISDRRLALALDNEAVNRIRQGRLDFELSVPTAYEQDEVGYKFVGTNMRTLYPDLVLQNYLDALGVKLAQIDSETLRQHRILAVYENNADARTSWTIHKSLVGSVSYLGQRYAINEGEWYRIDEAFKIAVEASYTRRVQNWFRQPEPLRKIYDEDNNGRYQSEASFNMEFAAAFEYIPLDTKMVNLQGVRRSNFEACDILDIEGKRFIHVKKSSRRSSVLSHFFKQGSNSAQNFRRVEDCWRQLRELVVEYGNGEDDGIRLDEARNDTDRNWTVEYIIADAPRAAGGFNIPFFSKITFRDEAQNLESMGYSVCIKFISLEPDQIL